MNKTTVFLILALCLILSCCDQVCNKTPTTPDDPDPAKPTATVDFSVVEDPFNIQHNSSNYVIDIHIKIKETNGVGVDVTDVKTEWVKNNSSQETDHSTGGRLPANGTLTLPVYSACPDSIKADFVRITVVGKDDNGHDISVNHKWDIKWSGLLAFQTQ